MTDYEPYLAEPAEPVVPGPLARWRPLLSVLATVLVALALAFMWVDSRGEQDPALTAPDATTPPAAPAADPAAPPAASPAP